MGIGRARLPWVPRMIRLLLPLLLLPACTGTTLVDEWELTIDQLRGLDLEVADALPAPDAEGVGTTIDPYVLFSRPLTRGERGELDDLELLRTDGSGSATGAPSLDDDRMGGAFELPGLVGGAEYDVVLPLPDPLAGSERSFQTRNIGGAAFDLSQELRVEAFGAAQAHADLLQSFFEPGGLPLWIMRDRVEPDGGPDQRRHALAPARLGIPEDDEPGWIIREDYGYVGSLRGVDADADGCFDHRQDGLFLPLWSGDEVILLYLQDVEWSGCLPPDGSVGDRSEALLSGVMTTRWLLRLRETGGYWTTAVDLLEPDVDTNGNDTADSATFTISLAPERVDAADLEF